MAVDTGIIVANLLSFYDFKDKTIISVGAGGGQFIEYARSAKMVYAVDNDSEALKKLSVCLVKQDLIHKFTLIHSEFEDVRLEADVVLFEFCLHEMKSTEIAVKHAFTITSDVLVSDHWPGSEWAYIVDEKEKVTNSWDALKCHDFRKIQHYTTIQRFIDYAALYEKVKGQGETSIRRIEKFKNQHNIEIPMSYGFALI